MGVNTSAPCLIARPRLLDRVAARWTYRVVAIVAGPGFGKSSLVAEARAEHVASPRGAELMISCTPADRSPAHFVGRIATLLGDGHCDPLVAASAERLGTELARRWPTGLCVVIDDVHHLTSTSEGRRLLSDLLADAPPTVHFLVTSRTPIPGLGVWRAAGDVVELSEREMALTAAEIGEMAAVHHVSVEGLKAMGGWPAATAVAAAYGVAGGLDYALDTIVERLNDDARRTLAIAAAIGRADAAVLEAATGIDAMDVLASIPLCDEDGLGGVVVHELWHRVVAGAISPRERRTAVTRAVHALVDRRDLERAYELCVEHSLWNVAADVLVASCRHGLVDLPAHVLLGWLDVLPRDRWEAPEGLLLRGIVGRVTEPFRDETVELLRRAAARFRAVGGPDGEVGALIELAYVARNQGRADVLPEILERVGQLHGAGHRGVAGLAAFGASLLAEIAGDDAQLVAVLEDVPAGALDVRWRAIIDFRLAIGYLTLGSQDAMLDAATRCAAAPVVSTTRHVLALARWFAGDPEPALRDCAEIVTDAGRSRVDGLALGSFATMVLATSGRVAEARVQLAATERVAVGPIAALMQGYLVGIRALVAAAEGDDDTARDELCAALATEPLTSVPGWRKATRWLALAYVLCEQARPLIDEHQVGPVHQRRLAIARLTVAAREGTAMRPADLAALRIDAVVTTLPLPWAMQLAGRLWADKNPIAAELVERLFDLHGAPARDALRNAGGVADRRSSDGARRLLATVMLTPARQLRVELLGPAALRVDGVPSTQLDWQRERVRSLLAFLAVRGPVRREEIIDALWPELDPVSADRNLRVTLTYLQRLLDPDRRKGEAPFFLRQHGATLTLASAPHLVVDVHEFLALGDRADAADRDGRVGVARQLLGEAITLWRGRCFEDVAYDEWAQGAIEAATSRFVRMAVRAGELDLACGLTEEARTSACKALGADPWCEPAHRVVIAAALVDGDRRRAGRAMEACLRTLVELGVEPSPETAMLDRRVRLGGDPALLSVSA